jgi:Family of unknown function (DUF5329)
MGGNLRMFKRRALMGVFLGALAALTYAGTPDSLEERKIEYLIASIENLQNAQFIRNGVAYEAKSAADHLRMKRQKAGSRVSTAEEFIRLCASVSSASGALYQIRFSDGRVITSEVFLRERLGEFGR